MSSGKVIFLYERKPIPIEQPFVAELEMGDDEQGHEGKGHEWRGKGAAQALDHRVDGGIGFGDAVAVFGAHQTGHGQGQYLVGRCIGAAAGRRTSADATQAPATGDHEIDGAADALVVRADGYDIMTVMGNRRSQRALLKTEIADKGDGYRGRPVAVDDDDLKEVFFGIGLQQTVHGAQVGDGDQELAGDELPVEGFDHRDLFRPGRREINEVGSGPGFAIKIVNRGRFGGARRRWPGAHARHRAARDLRNAAFSHEFTLYISLQHLKIHQVFDQDQVGGVALPQQTGVQLVMQDGINAGGFQYLERVDPMRHGPRAEPVDMAFDQAVGMLIIAAEHHPVGVLVEQTDQGLEIFGGAAFADEDLHAITQLIERLFGGETFVIGADAGGNILPGLFSS